MNSLFNLMKDCIEESDICDFLISCDFQEIDNNRFKLMLKIDECKYIMYRITNFRDINIVLKDLFLNKTFINGLIAKTLLFDDEDNKYFFYDFIFNEDMLLTCCKHKMDIEVII